MADVNSEPMEYWPMAEVDDDSRTEQIDLTFHMRFLKQPTVTLQISMKLTSNYATTSVKFSFMLESVIVIEKWPLLS
jgi:hypothetical protein